MEQDVLNTIAQKINPFKSKSKFIFLGEGYSPVELDKSNFRRIQPQAHSTIVFVDGGNAELAKGPNFSLQFIRTCAVIIEAGKRRTVRQEGTCLVQAVQKDEKLSYSVEVTGIDVRVPAIDLYEQSLAEGSHRVEPARVAELVRALAELQLAVKVAADLPANAMIIRDGDLQAHTIYEQNAFRELYEIGRDRAITIAGVSKQSGILTDTGHPAIPVLGKLGPEGTWYYHPIATSSRPDHQASVCIAKLHPMGRAFRIDIFDQQEAILPELIAALASNAEDAAFLGYPYGLIEADRFAKVRDEERVYLRARAELAFGNIIDEDAHSQLDRAT